MIVLGVSYLSDAGACIVKDGVLKSAVNEERLSRIKLFHGIPEKSIKWVIKDAGITLKDVDVIVTQGYCSDEKGIEFIDHGLKAEEMERDSAFREVEGRIRKSRLGPELKKQKIKELRIRREHEDYVIFDRNINIIRQLKKIGKPIKVVEHHMSHAASAYFTSGWNDCYIMTADGWGEMESNILCRGRNGKIEKLAYSHSFDSLGYFYGSITKALGFIPHRHEGKVLGLAASGKASRAIGWMMGMIRYSPEKRVFEGGFEKGLYIPRFENPHLEKMVKRHRREDIAAAAQKVLEKTVIEYVKNVVPKGSRLAVAGGIFANVRLNQKILELPYIKDLFVYPQMGDGGLAVGSALYYFSRVKKLKPSTIDSLYKGPEFKDSEIIEEVRRFGYSFQRYDDIEKRIARLLAGNNVIMRFAGRMEYGPRALGNRSILCSAADKSVNGWLNNALRRSEFMPFAPVTLKEKAEKCYKNIKNYWKRSLYMTITFDCTDWMKKVSQGVVHVDGTARPQLIYKDLNPSYYKILKYYYRLTGIPSIINTSFNMHEEPIVCSPNDALRAFQDSNLGYLAIGNYLVKAGQEDILFQSPEKVSKR